MLKNKSDLPQKENKDLFGKEFREQISETVKAHKQSKELLASAIFKDAAFENQFFGTSHHQTNNIVGGKVLIKTTKNKTAETSTGITSKMVNMQMRTNFLKEIPTLIAPEKLSYAHKQAKSLFLSGQMFR